MAEQQYIIIIILFAIISCLLIVLIWREKKKIKNLEEEMDSLSKVPFQKVTEMTTSDEAAYKIIEEERNRIWKNFSAETVLSVESLFSLSR
jgi:flagellar biosynthesis/type III secretory pathway M-ring protein FliF/YscJ